MSKPKCFVVMPMTTQPEQAALYNDKEHWVHVMNYLFVPAILKAEFEPMPPETKGGDVIHRNIMTNLGDSDMVLCDMSGLNANVFFEMGIRTALNKPIAAVVDHESLPVPFDTGVGQYHTYSSALNAWSNEDEIEKLQQHLRDVADFARGENSIWATFGFARIASMPEHDTDASDVSSVILSNIRRLSEQLSESSPATPKRRFYSQQLPAVTTEQNTSKADEWLQVGILRITIERDVYIVTGSGKLDPKMTGVPYVEVDLIEHPAGDNMENIMIRPGTGTNYDFNITLKSMQYGIHLPLGTYTFEYRACIEHEAEQASGHEPPAPDESDDEGEVEPET